MYYRVPFRVPVFFIKKFSFLMFSSLLWSRFGNATLCMYARGQASSLILFKLLYLRKQTLGLINSRKWLPSWETTFFHLLLLFILLMKGYCHLLVKNLKSNFIDDTLCSREWIFLSRCDNGAVVPSQYVHGEADNLLGYYSNRLLTPEDKKRLINPVQHLGSSSGVQDMLSSPYT